MLYYFIVINIAGFKKYLHEQKYSKRRIPIYINILKEFEQFAVSKNVNTLARISFMHIDEYVNYTNIKD